MKKIISISMTVILLVAAGIFLKNKKEQVANEKPPMVYTHNIQTVYAREKQIDQKRSFLSQIQSSKSAFIASKFNANIKRIYVDESDKVKKGQLLISLDDADIKANLASLISKKHALMSDLENTKTIFKRNKELYKIEAVSKETMQNSQVAVKNKYSALKDVEEKIKQTKSILKYLNITAPFDGVIGSKLADEGSLALAGKALLTLNSDDQKLIFSFVNTSKPILVGQKVILDKKVVGQVYRIYDDAKNNLLVAEVKLNKILKYANKSYHNIEVVVDTKKGCCVPTQSILHKNNDNYIMVFEQSRFQAKKVNILLENDEDVIIDICPKNPIAIGSEAKLSMLTSYEKVAINGQNNER